MTSAFINDTTIHPSHLSMKSLTPVILVDHDFKAPTNYFLVETTPNDLIFHLKEKVKEVRPEELSSVRRSDLLVWKTMGAKTINPSSEERLSEILNTIDVGDKATIQELPERLKLADLGLSEFQTLLVQLPGMSRIFTIAGRVLIQV